MYIKGSSTLNQILKYPLNVVSLTYKIISLLWLKIKSLYQKKYPEVYIISVDNLSFGGSGKTSIVIEIGETLQKRGIKFAIVTRGYKSKFEKKSLKARYEHSVEEIGDEARI